MTVKKNQLIFNNISVRRSLIPLKGEKLHIYASIGAIAILVVVGGPGRDQVDLDPMSSQ